MKWLLDIAYIGIGASYRWILIAVALVGILVGALFAAGILGGGDDDDETATTGFSTPVPLPTITPGPTPTITPIPTLKPTTAPTATSVPVVVLPTIPAQTQTPPVERSREIIVPIILAGAANLGSLEFVLAYDPDVVEVTSVETGTLTEESLLESSAGTPGLLWVGIIDAVGISEDGPAAVVTFKVIESSDSDTLLILQNVVAYDAASYLDIIVEASPGSFSTMDGSITPPSLTFAP